MPLPIRKYKDIDLRFTVHPKTRDLVYLKDTEAVKRSVKNIVLTNVYERHYNDSFGCGIREMLFEDVSFFTALSIQEMIKEVLVSYEPRITVHTVNAQPEEDSNGYTVSIYFSIKNMMLPVTVNFFLEKVE